MSKVKYHSIPKHQRNQLVGEFFDIVYSLKTKQEIVDFFIGLFTTSESLMMARRIQIAKLIIDKKKYEEIRSELGVGYGNIQSVDRWLHEREEAYLKVMIKHLKKVKCLSSREVKNRYQAETLLDRYPQHRLLKKLLGI